jgi:hypothetical protein
MIAPRSNQFLDAIYDSIKYKLVSIDRKSKLVGGKVQVNPIT